MQYDELKNSVTNIVFQPYFADVDDTQKKIGDVAPISVTDANIIKQNIQQQFGITLNCDIPDVSVNDICKIIYEYTGGHIWNRREIFKCVLSCFGNLLGRRVFPDDKISDLKAHIAPAMYEETITNLRCKFGESVNLLDTNPEWRIYNLANRITLDLAEQGRAIDPKEECAGMDNFWKPLWSSLSFGCLSFILIHNFGVWAPTDKKKDRKNTRELEQKTQNLKSYEELEDFVISELVKVKIDKIMFEYISIAGDFENRPQMSDFVIGFNTANYVKNKVQKDFNIKIDYDISGTRLKQLYAYVYENLKGSESFRNKIFDDVEVGSKSAESTETKAPKKEVKNLLSRDEVFTRIINKINCTLTNRITSVQRWDKICDLFADTVNPQSTKKGFNGWLRKNFYITVNLNDPNLNVFHICSKAYKSLVERGLAEDLRIKIADMHPLWGAINIATKEFGQVKSIIENEIGPRISVYNLSNCRTYWEYKQLVINSAILDKIRPIIAKHLGIMLQKITLSAPLSHNIILDFSKFDGLYDECEKMFNIRIPKEDRKMDSVEDIVKAVIENGKDTNYIGNILNGNFDRCKELANQFNKSVTALQTSMLTKGTQDVR